MINRDVTWSRTSARRTAAHDDKLRAAVFGLVFVFVFVSLLLLVASYAHADPDWAMVVTDPQGRAVGGNCSVDKLSCDLEIEAVQKGWLASELRGLNMRCEPRPGCRPNSDLVIRGYNDR